MEILLSKARQCLETMQFVQKYSGIYWSAAPWVHPTLSARNPSAGFLTALPDVDSRGLFPVKYEDVPGLRFSGQDNAQRQDLQVRGKLEL